MDKMLSSREVMAYLGVGRTTVYQLFRRADFPTTKVGRKVKVSEQALLEWCRAGGTAEKKD